MNKKFTVFSAVAVAIVLLIGCFLYVVNRGINQRMAALESAQQATGKNLQQLATFHWNWYQNDALGFEFKYPDYVYLCPSESPSASFPIPSTTLYLDLNIDETCAEQQKNKDASTIRIIVEKNTNHYGSEEAAFNDFMKEYDPLAPSSAFAGVHHFMLGGLDAYGGLVTAPNDGTWVVQSHYYAVILKNDMLFKVYDDNYDVTTGGKPTGEKPVFDAILSTLYFEPLYSPWQ